jgi:hypothetical protein
LNFAGLNSAVTKSPKPADDRAQAQRADRPVAAAGTDSAYRTSAGRFSFFARFSARFSAMDLAGFFFVSRLLLRSLLMTVLLPVE